MSLITRYVCRLSCETRAFHLARRYEHHLKLVGISAVNTRVCLTAGSITQLLK